MCSSFAWLLTGLDDVLGRVERMEQGLPSAVPRASQTSDTSGDEMDVSEPRRRVRTKKTFELKKVWGASELGRFFVTGPTDASGKPSHFYCRLCRKDVSVFLPRHARDPAPLSGDETFIPRSASSFGDSWLAFARLRGQRHERRRGCTPARSISEGSTGGKGQRISLFRRFNCRQ